MDIFFVLFALYILEVIFTIGGHTAYNIRLRKRERELGYVQIKRVSVFDRTLDLLSDTHPDITSVQSVIITFMCYLFPLSFVAIIIEHVDFDYDSLLSIKEEIKHGIIKLEDEETDELSLVGLAHKIVGVRKSIMQHQQEEEVRETSTSTVDERLSYLLGELENVYQELLAEPKSGQRSKNIEKGKLRALQKEFDNRLRG